MVRVVPAVASPHTRGSVNFHRTVLYFLRHFVAYILVRLLLLLLLMCILAGKNDRLQQQFWWYEIPSSR